MLAHVARVAAVVDVRVDVGIDLVRASRAFFGGLALAAGAVGLLGCQSLPLLGGLGLLLRLAAKLGRLDPFPLELLLAGRAAADDDDPDE